MSEMRTLSTNCFFFASKGKNIIKFQTEDPFTCNVEWDPLFLSTCFSAISCLKHMPLNHPASIQFDPNICGIFVLFQNNTIDYYFLSYENNINPSNLLEACDIHDKKLSYQIHFVGYSYKKISNILSQRKITKIYNVIEMSERENHEFKKVWLTTKYDINLYTIIDNSRWISTLLLKKNNQELNRIKYACHITQKGFEAAWKCFMGNTMSALKLRKVIHDFEAAIFPFFPSQYAYVPIITQSPEIHPNLDKDEVLDSSLSIVMDMGIRWQGMCCDITRTYLSNKSNTYQNKIYNLIYTTLMHVTGMVRPGVAFSALSEACFSKIAIGLVDLGLTTDNDSLRAAHQLMPHSLGHSIGWNVHDDGVYDPSDWILQEGHVLALEPGLYFKKEGYLNTLYNPEVYKHILESGMHAIRIEDTMTVTNNGVNVFSQIIPY